MDHLAGVAASIGMRGARASHRLSLVVPLHNEDGDVAALVAQVEAALDQLDWPWQLILVDDGSGDRIRQAIGLLCAAACGAALAWLAWHKLWYGEAIASRPLLLLGVLLALIGVQFICTGIVTEMLARTWFESGDGKTCAVREVLGASAIGTWPDDARRRATEPR